MCAEIIRLSAEDKYSLVDMSSKAQLFPHPFTLGNLGMAMADLTNNWEFLWDFRGSEKVYNDIRDAYDEARAWQANRQIILASPELFDEVQDSLATETARIVKMRPKSLPTHPFDLSAFADGEMDLHILTDEMLDVVAPHNFNAQYHEFIDSLGMTDLQSETTDFEQSLLNEYDSENPAFDFAIDESEETRMKLVGRERTLLLRRFLDSIGTNSLLTELAIVFDRERVKVVPYHSFSLHHVPAPRDRLVLLRPGRRSAQYWRRFKKDIRALENLLNKKNVKEHEIEILLRANPLFLRGLNYRKVYPQVILPLGGDNSLRPDAIAEPVDTEWCHVIDYKLPSQKILVGRENRLSLASGIIEVTSQLREYAAYFDDRSVAKVVEGKYGFKCYKPKLVAIVGRDPQDLDSEQVRRAMTAYPDLEVVTYDRLLRAAKRYLLL